MAIKEALIIFTKEPCEGKVKTRLAKSIGDFEATSIYKLLLNNLLNFKLNKNIDIYVSVLPFTSDYKKYFNNHLIFLQKGNNFGLRMSNSFKKLFNLAYDNVILIGSDIPIFNEKIINDSFDKLKNHDAIISKTDDQGYCLIGFNKNSFCEKTFDIDFNKEVYNQTIDTLKNLNVSIMDTYFDIDNINDLRKFVNNKDKKNNQKLYLYAKKLLTNLPKISVVIPVYYEKDNLRKTISKIKENSFYNDFEIIVCDTLAKTTINEIDCSNLRVAISKKAGRSFQLNEGATCAKSEILLFLHADTLVPKNWDKLIIDLHSKKQELCGAFSLGIDTNNLFIKTVEYLANLRVFFTNTPYGDQAQFFSASLFEKIGFYDEIPLMEDISIIKKVHSLNKKVEILNKKIYTSDRRWKEEGILYTSFRNRILSSLYFFGISSEKLKKYYKF